MFCPKCGARVDEGAAFCGSCGFMFESPIPDTQPEGAMPEEMIQQPQEFVPISASPAMLEPQVPTQLPAQPAAQVGRKSYKGLTVFLSILLAGAVAASALFYFNPGGIFGSDDDDDDDSSSKKGDSSSISSQVDSDDESSDNDESSEDETTTTTTTAETTTTTRAQPDETTTTTSDSSEPDDTSTTTTTTRTTQKPDIDLSEDPEFVEAMQRTTEDRPEFSEFDWCYGQADLIRKMPTGGAQIKSKNRMAGGWKCMFIYSTEKDGDMLARELNNVYIDPTADNVSMTIDWYLMEIPESDNIPEDKMDDTTFDVNIASNGALTAKPPEGTIVISQFWKEGDNDYAVGEYQTDSGLYAYIALYR